MSQSTPGWELFHQIAQQESAEVRRRLMELGLMEAVGLRNVSFESHRLALESRGGSQTPALWDGQRLHVGREAVLQRLSRPG